MAGRRYIRIPLYGPHYTRAAVPALPAQAQAAAPAGPVRMALVTGYPGGDQADFLAVLRINYEG
jgi:hypothetical protein